MSLRTAVLAAARDRQRARLCRPGQVARGVGERSGAVAARDQDVGVGHRTHLAVDGSCTIGP